MKEKFIQLLRSTNRDGVEKIITNLEKLGFFEAPASTKHHLAKEGGLCEHSVSVCETAIMMREDIVKRRPELEKSLPYSSVVLAALLHDVCKSEIYKKSFRNVRNEIGKWEQVPSYEVDCSYFPMGHGEKSVIRLQAWGISLTMSEMAAIFWHMGAWGLPMHNFEQVSNFNAARKKFPLVTLLICADDMSSSIFEIE